MLRSRRALFIAVLVALPALVRAQSGVAPDADVRVQRLVAAVSETRLRAPVAAR